MVHEGADPAGDAGGGVGIVADRTVDAGGVVLLGLGAARAAGAASDTVTRPAATIAGRILLPFM